MGRCSGNRASPHVMASLVGDSFRAKPRRREGGALRYTCVFEGYVLRPGVANNRLTRSTPRCVLRWFGEMMALSST